MQYVRLFFLLTDAFACWKHQAPWCCVGHHENGGSCRSAQCKSHNTNTNSVPTEVSSHLSNKKWGWKSRYWSTQTYTTPNSEWVWSEWPIDVNMSVWVCSSLQYMYSVYILWETCDVPRGHQRGLSPTSLSPCMDTPYIQRMGGNNFNEIGHMSWSDCMEL